MTAQNRIPYVKQSPQVVDVPLLDVQHQQLLVPPEKLLPAEAAVDVLRAGFAVARVSATLKCKTFYKRLRESLPGTKRRDLRNPLQRKMQFIVFTKRASVTKSSWW